MIKSRVFTYTINKHPIVYVSDKKIFIKKGSIEKKIEFLTDNNIIKKEVDSFKENLVSEK